jgi:electron transport complex protein RnfC
MFFRKSKGLHISEYPGHKELSLQVGPSEFLKPEFIYIPLVEQGAPCESLVKVGEKVVVGQPVAMKSGRFGLPLHSSVSGEVIAIDKKMWHSSGSMVAMIEIKNDFKETMSNSIKQNDVSKLNKEDIIKIARECGIVGLGGSGFPTYVKYQSPTPITTIIVNAVECEPFLTADYTLVKTQTNKLINGIKYAMKANSASKAYIAIKYNKVAAIEILIQSLASEDNIEVFTVKDIYPAGWEKYIVQKVLKKTYKNLPSEVGAVVNNVATLVALSEAVENNMPLVKKLVTFTGKGLNAPQNVYVKIGTKINDVIANIGGYVPGLENVKFVAGGLMTGRTIMFDSLVINRSLGSVIVLPKEKEAPLLPCLGCGKCCVNCPVFLSPIEIKRAFDGKNNDKLVELRAEKCIQCGLCSYVCPSRIELTEATTKSRSIVLKGGK